MIDGSEKIDWDAINVLIDSRPTYVVQFARHWAFEFNISRASREQRYSEYLNKYVLLREEFAKICSDNPVSHADRIKTMLSELCVMDRRIREYADAGPLRVWMDGL